MQTLRKKLKRAMSPKPNSHPVMTMCKSMETLTIDTTNPDDSDDKCTTCSTPDSPNSHSTTDSSSSPCTSSLGLHVNTPQTTEIMQHITERDEALFRIIRTRVGDQLTDTFYDTDFNLKRWLMGHNYNLEKIVPKLKAHCSYRHALGLDDINELESMTNPMMNRFYPSCQMNWLKAKDESHVQVLCLGHMDMAGLLKSSQTSHILSSRVMYIEQCLKNIMHIENITGRRTYITWVLDLQGLKYDSWTLAAVNGPFKALAQFLLANYVEITRRILVINSGKLLYSLWRMLQPIIPQKTKNKIHIFGSKSKNEIRLYIDPKLLPERWGGCILDAEFDRHIVVPESVPPEFLYKPTLDEPPDIIMEQRIIIRHTYYMEEVIVADERSYMQWYMKADGEVSIGVLFSEKRLSKMGGDSQALASVISDCAMLVPVLNVWPIHVPEQGRLLCSTPGYYYLLVVNSGPMFNRQVKLHVKLNSSTVNHWNSLRMDAPGDSGCY